MIGNGRERTRVAVIGAGYMGTHHALKYHSMANVELVAIVDPVFSTRASVLASKLDCLAFTSVGELLASGTRVDAATVASPTNTHAPIASELLMAGVSCLVEKPLAHNSVAAQALVELAALRSLVLLPGHIERFNPAVRAVRERRPQISYITAYRVGPISFRSIDIDVVMDVMTHDIDIALFLTGASDADVVVTRAFAAPEGINDIAKAEIRLGTCIADLVASRLAIARRRKMRIFAADGYFSIDCSKGTAVHVDRGRYFAGLRDLRLYQEMGREIVGDSIFAAVGAEHMVDVQRHGSDALAEELKYFLSVVRGEALADALTASDGVKVIRIAEAIIAGCSGAQSIQLSDTFRRDDCI